MKYCPSIHRKAVWGPALKLVSPTGLIAEFGVFRGVTLSLLAKQFYPRIIHGFDSFEGLPEDWRQGYKKGKFNLPAHNSIQFPENSKLHVGWFNDTIPAFSKEYSEKVALLHIDCDLYSSTKIILDNLGNRLVPGSILIFDEYWNYEGYRDHEYKAFQEFLAISNLKAHVLACNDSTQVSFIMEQQ